MLTLNSPPGTNYRTDPNDLVNTKQALNRLGYYAVPPQRGIDDWADSAMFDAIKKFQRDNALKVDGFMRPGGPTEQKMNIHLAANEKPLKDQASTKPWLIEGMKQSAGAASDMLRNFLDMRQADWKFSDKYFHCKGSCEATRRGPAGEATAEAIGDAREWFDQKLKGDAAWDSEEDQKANRTGRAVGRQSDQSCGTACGQYRPRGLPQRY